MTSDHKGTSLRRLLATVILIAGPIAISGLAVVNLLDLANGDVEAAQKTGQVEAFKRRLNTPTADGKPLDITPIYLTGSSRTLASATLQQRLEGIIASASGRLIETAPIDLPAPASEREITDIGLKATLDIDNDGLLHLLLAVETGLPLLDIDSLSIRRAATDGSDTAQPILRVDFAVRGHWKVQPL